MPRGGKQVPSTVSSSYRDSPTPQQNTPLLQELYHLIHRVQVYFMWLMKFILCVDGGEHLVAGNGIFSTRRYRFQVKRPHQKSLEHFTGARTYHRHPWERNSVPRVYASMNHKYLMLRCFWHQNVCARNTWGVGIIEWPCVFNCWWSVLQCWLDCLNALSKPITNVTVNLANENVF